jgi:hypothetical protein
MSMEKPEQMEAASANAFGAGYVSLAFTMRDRLARSLLLARNAGAALGVRTGVFKPCRCVYPQCDEMTTCLREKSARSPMHARRRPRRE